MAKMDTWVDQMIKDMGIGKKEEGEKNNEVALSDADIDKVADRVISKLSEEPEVSTPKQKKKETDKPPKPELEQEELEEGETSLEEE